MDGIFDNVVDGMGNAIGNVGDGLARATDNVSEWVTKYKWWLLGGAAVLGGLWAWKTFLPPSQAAHGGMRGVGGFGQEIGPRWRTVRETEHAATYSLTERGVGRCGDITATVQCSKRPGKPVFGKAYSCSGQIAHMDPYTRTAAVHEIRRIPARTFGVAVESALLEADAQVARQAAKCYPRKAGAVQHEEWNPVEKMWQPVAER